MDSWPHRIWFIGALLAASPLAKAADGDDMVFRLPAQARPARLDLASQGIDWRSLRIIAAEAPQTGGMPFVRPHRAIRFASPGATLALREMGLAVNQCETQARLPSRWRQSGGGVQVGFNLSLSCRY